MTKSQKQTSKQTLVKQLLAVFKDEHGVAYDWAEGQLEIVEAVLFRNRKGKKRVITIASTQYGKSLSVALALILRTHAYPEKWAIVAPSDAKAKIIMNYVIQHLFDDEQFVKSLDIDIPMERLKRERSRNKLTFNNGAEIVVYSADSRNRQRVKEALMGFGAPNVILDESALIPDDLYATVKRMIGGTIDNFMFEISNPWERNHFYRTWLGDGYEKIFIDYKRALAEGRYDEAFIEEMRAERFFDILYECEFPPQDMVNDQGWRRLISDEVIRDSQTDSEKYMLAPVGEPRLGIDVARGGANYTVMVLRYDNIAQVVERNSDNDLMAQVPKIVELAEQYNIQAGNIFIDDVGVGGGITNRLQELDYSVTAVSEGKRAVERDKYVNTRSEMYWLLGEWLNRNEGRLYPNEGWNELRHINYKQDSSSKLKIEPKADMQKRGIMSPDVADALSLTFHNNQSFSSSDFSIM
ncbi:terminase large subunit domain-containing protein [Polynucleobacter sp.]|uniref:terminase large subunit domain-containing protein n=1 Tax=Polynucleobacter sp. TaxID=2029855 RepID=UPI003F6A281C